MRKKNIRTSGKVSYEPVRGTEDRMDNKLAERFMHKVGIHHGSALTPFPFTVVVDVVTEVAREGVLSGQRGCVKWPERVC